MTYEQAKQLIDCHRIPLNQDFHALPSGIVASIILAADAYRYRVPADANGSRARYFHAFLQRTIAKGA